MLPSPSKTNVYMLRNSPKLCSTLSAPASSPCYSETRCTLNQGIAATPPRALRTPRALILGNHHIYTTIISLRRQTCAHQAILRTGAQSPPSLSPSIHAKASIDGGRQNRTQHAVTLIARTPKKAPIVSGSLLASALGASIPRDPGYDVSRTPSGPAPIMDRTRELLRDFQGTLCCDWCIRIPN